MPSRSRRMRYQQRRPLRLVPVPATTPPPAVQDHAAPGPRTHGSLALAQPARNRTPPDPVRQPAPASPAPALREVAQSLAQLVADVLTGNRPALQLAGKVSPSVYEALATAVAGRRVIVANRRLIVWRTRVCVPASGVAEVSAVAHDTRRAYPLALRLERDATGRWRCVAVAAPLSRSG